MPAHITPAPNAISWERKQENNAILCIKFTVDTQIRNHPESIFFKKDLNAWNSLWILCSGSIPHLRPQRNGQGLSTANWNVPTTGLSTADWNVPTASVGRSVPCRLLQRDTYTDCHAIRIRPSHLYDQLSFVKTVCFLSGKHCACRMASRPPSQGSEFPWKFWEESRRPMRQLALSILPCTESWSHWGAGFEELRHNISSSTAS